MFKISVVKYTTDMDPEIKLQDNTKTDFETAIQIFFDNNLKPGMAYGSDRELRVDVPDQGVLIYQDGTACSASYAFSYVFKMPNDTYIVTTDYSGCSLKGIESVHCENLCKVLKELFNRTSYDANTTGEMCLAILNYDTYMNCYKNNLSIISELRSHPNAIKIMTTKSWIYNKKYLKTDF